MYILKRTKARAAFKDLLGQANHFLITILIGLNGVREGRVEHDPEFHAAWNPRDIVRSADRSRAFALDLALVRAVDALDSFMMMSRRAPSSLGCAAFESQMDSTGQSVLRRLNLFSKHVGGIPPEYVSFMRLAIIWRNKKVHSLADENISADDERTLTNSADSLSIEFNGLSIVDLIRRFKTNTSPSFKDAASIISLTHKLVEFFDAYLLDALVIEEYVRGTLRSSLSISQSRSECAQIKHAAHKIWGIHDKRQNKVERALRLIGVHRAETSTGGREVPGALIEKILGFSTDEAIDYLSI